MEHPVPITRRAIMPRRVQSIKRPEIKLDATLPVPLYKQLYERLRSAILTGQLERGTRLPSTRSLASELGVARMTTVLAYEQLVLEGYLESRVGQGTVVACSLPATLFNAEIDSKQEERTDSGKASSIHLASCLRPLKDLPWPSREAGKLVGRFPAASQGSICFLTRSGRV
jgi:DNA-binding transcriptional regulator YhcF (GntR family)